MPELLAPFDPIPFPNADALPVAFADDLQDLTSCLVDSVDAAIWNRQLPGHIATWLSQLEPLSLPEGRYVLAPARVEDCLNEIFSNYRLSAVAALDWLSADAQALASKIKILANAPLIRLRLDAVFDDACSKMHIDNVVTRLICTYRGPGTELGLESTGNDSLATIPTGMPVLLKGRRWPSKTAPALRHRSPKISATGQVRLVLVLEACTAADIIPSYDQIFEARSPDH